MIHNTPASQLYDRIANDFNFSVKDRLHIAADVAMFRKGEDEGIWKQAKTGEFEYEVYWDGEQISSFSVNTDKDVAYRDFWLGFQKAYQDKRIFINPVMYEIEKEYTKKQEKEKKDRLEALGKKARTPEEKLVHEAIVQAQEESSQIIPTRKK